MMNRLRKEQEGLTLIELIVVVAIIGVLAWLITPRVLEALNNAKVQSALAVATELQNGLERYATDNDAKYPDETGVVDWGDLTDPTSGVLASYVTIAQSQSTNILLNDPNPENTSISYQNFDGTATAPSRFCFILRARDRNNTYIMVEESGITTDATASPTCPTTY